MTAKQSVVKRYIVRLSAEEREQLNALIKKGEASARRLVKVRILLKVDASEAGEGWSDSQIAAALDTSTDTVYRTARNWWSTRPIWPTSASSTAPPRPS